MKRKIVPVKQSLPSFLVGITTCYGEAQIIETVKSLRSSLHVPSDFRIVIVADHVKIKPYIKAALEALGVELYENKYETSAFAKQKQILDITTEEIVILTQDDVLFDPLTVVNTLRAFDTQGITFVGVRNQPLRPLTLTEGGISIGTTLSNSIGKYWNKGDNYLACLGRLMAFKTAYLKSMYVETDSVSLDAYLYFENKKMGGKYKCIWDTPLYFRSPQNIIEHIRKSSRFQYSKDEMDSYERFGDLTKEYTIPKTAIIKGALVEFFKNPVYFALYIGIFAYTRLFKIKVENCLYPNWEVDESTKEISFSNLLHIRH